MYRPSVLVIAVVLRSVTGVAKLDESGEQRIKFEPARRSDRCVRYSS
jgi:hypothetical protein